MRDLLDEARRGTLPGMVRTGASCADAAAEYLRWIEHDVYHRQNECQGANHDPRVGGSSPSSSI